MSTLQSASGERLQERATPTPIPADRKTLRLSAGLLIAGVILSLVVGQLHPAREAPNNHPAVFAEYAASTSWTPVHLGQFAGWVVLVAGLLALVAALNLRSGAPGLVGRLAGVSAAVTLALCAVLQAVDGVALKRAVDAWASAPVAEKAARFASAEAVRWLEEAVRSYQDFMLGLTFILLAIAIVSVASIPRPVGYLMGLTGVFYLAQGWVLGGEGFSPAHGLTQLPAYLFILVWIAWLAVAAWRMKEPAGAQG